MSKKTFFDELFKYESCIFIVVILFSLLYFKFDLTVKVDTVLTVLGNLAIAYFIAKKITKSLKTEELKISNCFKELDYLQSFINDLRNDLNKNGTSADINRMTSLIMLQIELIKKYFFISEQSKEKIFKQFQHLEKQLTEDENKLDERYKFSLLQIERTILNIKSNILE